MSRSPPVPVRLMAALLRLLGIVLLVGHVWGQKAEGVCQPSFSWMTNSLGQNPCIVGSYLEGECIDTVFDVAALPAGRHYVGPASPAAANPCVCSTVAYSLISACAICQGGTQIEKWSDWKSNCTNAEVNVASYPMPIPSGTSVPAWAYQDVTAEDTFDPNTALSVANQNLPEHTGAGTAPAPATSAIPSPSSKKSTPIGAIVGGAVGGVVVLGILAVLIAYLFILRKRKRTPPSAAWSPQKLEPNDPTRYTISPFPFQSHPYAAPPIIPPPTPRLYDPNDPRTFPSANHAPQNYSPAPTGSPAPFQVNNPRASYSATHLQTYPGHTSTHSIPSTNLVSPGIPGHGAPPAHPGVPEI